MTSPPTGVDDLRPPATPTLGRRIFKFVVIAIVVATTLVFVDPREVGGALRVLPVTSMVLAVVVLSLDRFMMGLKWRQLVQSTGTPMRLIDAVSIYYQSKFATLVFPATFGGEVLRGFLGNRAGIPGHVVVASMVIERVIAALSSLMFAAIGFLYLSNLPSYARFERTVVILVLAGTVGLALIAVLALHRPSHRLIGRALRGWVPGQLLRLLDRLSVTAVRFKHEPGVLFTNLMLTLIEHFLQMLALYILANGLGVQLPMPHFMAATSIIMLVRRGAGILEGWGIAEGGVVMLYTLFGLTASRSAALAVALWATSVLACLPGAYLLSRGAWRAMTKSPANALEETT